MAVLGIPRMGASCQSAEELFTSPHWYAVYTRSRQEKRVAQQLTKREVTCFLPLRKVARLWKNRKRVVVEFAIFTGYVFVKIGLWEKLRVLETPGVVRLVGFNAQPVPIPAEQIEALVHLVQGKMGWERHRYLSVGKRVEVTAGSLRGLRGILVRHKGSSKLILSVELIRQSVALEVDASCVELLTG